MSSATSVSTTFSNSVNPYPSPPSHSTIPNTTIPQPFSRRQCRQCEHDKTDVIGCGECNTYPSKTVCSENNCLVRRNARRAVQSHIRDRHRPSPGSAIPMSSLMRKRKITDLTDVDGGASTESVATTSTTSPSPSPPLPLASASSSSVQPAVSLTLERKSPFIVGSPLSVASSCENTRLTVSTTETAASIVDLMRSRIMGNITSAVPIPENPIDSIKSNWPAMQATITALQETLDEIKQRIQCVVCLDAPRSILFGPCHHCCVCKTCGALGTPPTATKLVHCPICSNLIHTRTAIFLS